MDAPRNPDVAASRPVSRAMAEPLFASGKRHARAGEIDHLILLDDAAGSRSLLDGRKLRRSFGAAFEQPAYEVVALRHALAFGTLAAAERTVADIMRAPGNAAAIEARLGLARIAQLRGDFILARHELAANERYEAIAHGAKLRLDLARASLAYSAGDSMRGSARFRTVAHASPASRRLDHWTPEILVEATRCARDAGDARTADRIASFADSLFDRLRSPSFAAVAAQVRGLTQRDLTLLARALEIARTSPRPLVFAQAALDYGTACIERGASGLGIAILDESWETFTRIGARSGALAAQRTLARAGVRRRKWQSTVYRPLEGWAALTEMEQRVARLIGEGHTNRSAALQLGSTANTIGSHVRAIFGKLGIGSRIELARMLAVEA